MLGIAGARISRIASSLISSRLAIFSALTLSITLDATTRQSVRGSNACTHAQCFRSQSKHARTPANRPSYHPALNSEVDRRWQHWLSIGSFILFLANSKNPVECVDDVLSHRSRKLDGVMILVRTCLRSVEVVCHPGARSERSIGSKPSGEPVALRSVIR